MSEIDYEKRLRSLKDLLDIQCSDGNWDYNEYARGYANGLILADAIMRDETPCFLDSPDEE